MIHDSILDVVGRTPVVRLASLSGEIGCDVYAKLESLNPGGSHKIRIALGMIRDAEAKGILTRGSGQTILEPSGGNTGIGLAMAAAHHGYRLVLVIPDNYSREKRKLLRLFGARVILSDSRLGNNSHGDLAMSLQLEHPDWVMLNQQRNPANPETHRTSTAREILHDFDGRQLDCFVGGIGTGGHLTGIGRVLRERWSGLRIYGVEPEGCRLLDDVHRPHGILGLSIGLRPAVLDVGLLDEMVAVSEAACLAMARKLLANEAISVGLSSAANFVAIARLARERKLAAGAQVLTMVYDGVESYLSSFAPAGVGEIIEADSHVDYSFA